MSGRGTRINDAKSEDIFIRNVSGKCHRLVDPQSKLLRIALEDMESPFKSSLKYLEVTFEKLNYKRAKQISGTFSNLF